MRISHLTRIGIIAAIFTTSEASSADILKYGVRQIFANHVGDVFKVDPTSTTEFTLSKPVLITHVQTYHRGATLTSVANGGIKIIKNGKSLVDELSVSRVADWKVIQPYLVLPPGTFTISDSDKSTWAHNENSKGGGIAVVMGGRIPAKAEAKVNAYFNSNPDRPVTLSKLLELGALSPDDFKQDLDSKTLGLQTGLEGSGKFDDLSGRGRDANENATGDSSGAIKKPGLNIAPSKIPNRYQDTPGGDRIDGNRNQNPDDFTGGRSGQVNSGGSSDADLIETARGAIRDAGGIVTGDDQKDAEEAAFMMSVGSDLYEVTKNMSKSERRDLLNAYANAMKLGEITPNPADDPASPFRPFGSRNMRKQQSLFIKRMLDARKGKLGAPPKQLTSGPAVLPSGKDDKPTKERAATDINWDKVFEINTKINPQR